MCSRAQYKLILVISRDNLLLQEIHSSTETEITVHNIEDVDKRPALLMAIENGNVTLVKKLLECGASTSDRNADGLTPLVIATEKGDVAIVGLLLQFAPSTSDRNADGLTPYLIATKQRNSQIVKLLLDNGVDFVEEVDAAARKGLIPPLKKLQQSLRKDQPLLLELRSRSGAGEYQGDRLGLYHLTKDTREESKRQGPVYRQLHDRDNEQWYLYRAGNHWRVSAQLGEEGGSLKAEVEEANQPPVK